MKSVEVRFLCDENISVPVYRALAEAEIDIAHILALGLGGIADLEVFRYAREEGRILLTRNYGDFALLVERSAKAGVGFPGVLFVATSISQADVGAHVQALDTWIDQAKTGMHQIENTYGWLA